MKYYVRIFGALVNISALTQNNDFGAIVLAFVPRPVKTRIKNCKLFYFTTYLMFPFLLWLIALISNLKKFHNFLLFSFCKSRLLWWYIQNVDFFQCCTKCKITLMFNKKCFTKKCFFTQLLRRIFGFKFFKDKCCQALQFQCCTK